MCFNKLITLFIIFIMLVNPVLAADTGQSKEKIIDNTKEKETKIINKDKSITGDIKVTAKDVSKFSVKKKSEYEISISKSGEHAKAKVSFPKSELQKIDIDKDGKFGLLHISDTGEVTHTTATEAELVAGKVMTFSTNIVNGYSGYKQYTFSSVTSGQTLNIEDVSGNYTITAAVDGVVPTYTAGIPTSGLLAEWTFDGSNYTDSSGNGHTGTKTGNVSFATDKNGGKCLFFNGTTGYINVGVVAIEGKNATLIADVRPAFTTSAQHRSVFSRYYLQQGLQMDTAGKIRNVMNDVVLLDTTVNTNSTWIQTAITYNGTLPSAQLKSYSKDSLVKTGTLTADITNDNRAWTIGASGTASPGYFFNGWVDNVRMYTQPLSVSELRQVYSGGSGISFQPEPSYNFTGYDVASGVEKVLNTDATCTGIEYVDTAGGTHDVTVTVYFTEDTTLISDLHDTDSHNVNFVHTSTYNAENGSMTYEKLGGYDRTATFTSNNTNATIVQNLTHFTLYTGTLQAGDSYYYNVSVPWKLEKTIFVGNWCKWTGTGWDFVNTTPTNNSASLAGQLEVTVS